MSFLFGSPSVPHPKVTRMPDMTDPSVTEAEQRRRQAILQRSGRASTFLTRRSPNASGSAGTEAYTNSVLGQS